ncbi:hypothetical protein CNR27_09945 [Luteimonas chenhongjianii]|uniref:DUF4124 domain-containing protein n=1 Tax=Luteimonas chenhongjianii TaxID=2006110 RepID=A0A290XF04_9GAMM|nr:hypothetical protein CNR27_09945 [Luteimonas chenhongjianii]
MACVLVLWWGGMSATDAQSVFKCADARGGHSYQSEPCSQGAPLRTWTADGPPVLAEVPAASSPVSHAPVRRTPGAGERRGVSPRVSRSRGDDQQARCTAARANREAVLHKLGTRRRYDDLRRLNDRVSAVCNHRGQ